MVNAFDRVILNRWAESSPKSEIVSLSHYSLWQIEIRTEHLQNIRALSFPAFVTQGNEIRVPKNVLKFFNFRIQSLNVVAFGNVFAAEELTQ